MCGASATYYGPGHSTGYVTGGAAPRAQSQIIGCIADDDHAELAPNCAAAAAPWPLSSAAIASAIIRAASSLSPLAAGAHATAGAGAAVVGCC